jgi:hypothetical protein
MYLFLPLQWGIAMKKVDEIRYLLTQEYTPRQVAERVPCSLSLVYEVRGKCDLAILRHEIAGLRLAVGNLHDRLDRLEGKPADIIERLEQRRHA